MKRTKNQIDGWCFFFLIFMPLFRWDGIFIPFFCFCFVFEFILYWQTQVNKSIRHEWKFAYVQKKKRYFRINYFFVDNFWQKRSYLMEIFW